MITSRFMRGIAAAAALLVGSSMAGRAEATSMVHLEPEDLAHLADAIVVADVVSVKSEFDGRMIRTFNRVVVHEVWKGDLEKGEQIEVVELGGIAGGRAAVVEGTPGYYTEERVLLFLEPRTRAGRGWRTIGMEQGKFTLLPNGAGGYGLVRVRVPLAERGQRFDPKKAPSVRNLANEDFATFAGGIKSVIESDRKAGVRGKDLPQYKGIGR